MREGDQVTPRTLARNGRLCSSEERETRVRFSSGPNPSRRRAVADIRAGVGQPRPQTGADPTLTPFCAAAAWVCVLCPVPFLGTRGARAGVVCCSPHLREVIHHSRYQIRVRGLVLCLPFSCLIAGSRAQIASGSPPDRNVQASTVRLHGLSWNRGVYRLNIANLQPALRGNLLGII